MDGGTDLAAAGAGSEESGPSTAAGSASRRGERQTGQVAMGQMQNQILEGVGDDADRLLAGLLKKYGSAEAKWDLIAADFCALTGGSKSKQWFKRRAKNLNLDEAVSIMAFEYTMARMCELGLPDPSKLAAVSDSP